MRDLPAISIVCFGEILWDCVPRGLFLGGAPLNVAYHMSRHGVRSLPISAVGQDFLGREARRRIETWGVETRAIAISRRFPTGTVRVTVDRRGASAYRIARAVAWDHVTPPLLRAQRTPAPVAVVFGTLALREPPNRRVLVDLLLQWPAALRVLDLNLRRPFDRPETIKFALGQAQFLKVNDLELARLAGAKIGTTSALERAVRGVAEHHGLSRICVTAGERGAGLLWHGTWYWEKARPVSVRDTVGAGDAFLGGLLAALLGRRLSPAAALAKACRMGEFVAARDGATPPYRYNARGEPRDEPL